MTGQIAGVFKSLGAELATLYQGLIEFWDLKVIPVTVSDVHLAQEH